MKEDLNYLSNWTKDVLRGIHNANNNKHENDILVFMIGNTANSDSNNLPYQTPLRKIVGGYVLGSIVFTQTQVIILSTIIDGLIDYIFIDAEKKLDSILDPDITPFEFFGITDYQSDNSIEYGNISSACLKVINTTPVYEYKANDITIDATWHFLIEKYVDLSGKKIVIIGAGNIGNKLALKLVECGASIILITNNMSKSIGIVKGLNAIKHRGVISEITLSEHHVESSKNADAIIGCTNSQPVISLEMVSEMNVNGVVIDLGKGTIFESAIIKCIEKDIQTWRVDISALVNSMVSSSRSMSNLVKNTFGRMSISNDVALISGGFIGKKYDVIVDSYLKPTLVIGVSDKPGKIMIHHDKKAIENIDFVKKYIESKD
jgi:hypothetical protein